MLRYWDAHLVKGMQSSAGSILPNYNPWQVDLKERVRRVAVGWRFSSEGRERSADSRDFHLGSSLRGR